MIDLYTWTTPNGRKASIMLEEVGLPYEVHAVNLGEREQFSPEFIKVSPNSKIPAIVDREGEGGPVSVFESGAILIYLAEKTDMLLPREAAQRVDVMQWLMWQMGGIGPMFGQAFHFISSAPDNDYGVKRYVDESLRLLGVLNGNLAGRAYMAGDYSIADVASYAWVKASLPFLTERWPERTADLEHVRRWLDDVGARPAVQRGMLVPA